MLVMHRITPNVDSHPSPSPSPSPPKPRSRFLSFFRRQRSVTTSTSTPPSPPPSAPRISISMGAHQSTHCPFTGKERRRRASTHHAHSPANKSAHHERHATAAHLTDKVFSRDAVKAFEKSELSMLDGLFKEISFPHSVSGSKKEIPVLDKLAFLRLFKVPGLLGERLFAVFDTKHQGVIDYDEFIAGLATYCRGSTEDKLKMLFDMYDVTGTGAVSREELKTMLYSLITPAHYFFQQSTSPHPQQQKSSTPTPEPLQRDTSMNSSSAHSSTSSSETSTTPMEIHTSPSADSSPGILARRIAARIADRSDHGPTSHHSHHSDDTLHLDDRNDWNSLDREFRSLKVMDDHQLVESIVNDAFDKCDTSKDGKLQFDEFAEFIRQTPTVVEALEKAFVFQYWNDHHTQQHSRKSPHTSPKQHSRHASLTVPSHPMRKSMTVEGISSTDRPNVSRSISHNGLTPPSNTIPTSRSFTSLHDMKPRSLVHSVSLNHTSSSPTIYCRDCGFQLRFCHGCGSTLVIQSLSNITCTSPTCHMTSNDYQHCTQCGHILEETNADLPLVQSPVTAKVSVSSQSPRAVAPMANTLAASADDIINENLYHSGILYKQGKYLKRWKQRWSVLRHNILYIFEDCTELRCSAALFMESQFVDIPVTDDHAREGYYAIVLTNMRTKIARTLYFKSQEDRTVWVSILKKAAKSAGIESRYELGKQIGKGKFSTVCEAKQIETGDMYAVKVIDKSRVCSDPMELEALRTEIAILRLIDHPYVVKMREMFVSKSHLYLVMDLLRGGDLFDRLIQRGHFSEHTTRLIIHKLLLAIQYLHARGIVHRDLKPENILCISEDDDSHVMIADFGLSKFATPSEVMNLPCGTLAYVAPEVLKLQGYGKSVDLWSIGIIGFLLLSGILPFDGSSKAQIIERTLHAKIHFDAPVFKDVSDDAKDVIGRLLHKNPTQRMTVDEALSHKWFADLKKKESPRVDSLRGSPRTQPLSAPSQPITISQAISQA